MTEAERVEQPGNLAELIVDISDEFDQRTVERHAMGAEKYGPGKFLLVDTLEEAIDEILDLANYARYTFIKLRMLQLSLQASDRVPEDLDTGFVTARQQTKVKED